MKILTSLKDHKAALGFIGELVWRSINTVLLLIITSAIFWLDNRYVKVEALNEFKKQIALYQEDYKKENNKRFEKIDEVMVNLSRLLSIAEIRLQFLEKNNDKMERKLEQRK